jgi:molybdopterin molybdotransferase
MAAVAELLTLEEAQRRVLERTRALPAEVVPVPEAAGRVLAEPARAAVDLPPFPSSAMDGFALRAAETPGTLPVSFRIAAGRPSPRSLAAGEAMAVATGGVVPEGADAVIPLEYVVEHDNHVEVGTQVEVGANVRPRGGDIRADDVVVPAGVRLAPAHVGALAAAGIARVACARRPRAAVLSTGTELQEPGRPLAAGQVYEANSQMLAAQLARVGAEVERLSAVEDDPGSHREALARGLEADVLVTSGGVSVGPHDLVRAVGGELGVDEVFWGVAVKPGKPLFFGVRGEKLIFGLPGNPVSALVGSELFVLPALLALQGHSDPLPRFEPATLLRSLRRNPQRDELVRAVTGRHGDEITVAPVTGQDSHMIARAASADALVLVRRGEGELPEGARVERLLLGRR